MTHIFDKYFALNGSKLTKVVMKNNGDREMQNQHITGTHSCKSF